MSTDRNTGPAPLTRMQIAVASAVRQHFARIKVYEDAAHAAGERDSKRPSRRGKVPDEVRELGDVLAELADHDRALRALCTEHGVVWGREPVALVAADTSADGARRAAKIANMLDGHVGGMGDDGGVDV